MNKLAPLFLAVAVALAALVVYQSQQAAHLRAVIAQMNKDAAGAREESDTHSSEIRALQERARTQKVAIAQLEARNKELAHANDGPGSAAATTAESGAEESGGFMKGFAKMFTDPKMKEAMRAQQAAGVVTIYGNLAQELGLNPEEARRVLALLADRQVKMVAEGMAALTKNGVDGKSLAESGKQTEQSKAAYDEELKGVLGAERFAKFQQYEKSLGERLAFDQVRNQLSAGGLPLDAKQSQGLLAIMNEERAATPNPVGNPMNPAAQSKLLESGEGMDAFVKSQETFHRRVLDRARTVLSSDQVLALEAAQKQQLEIQRMGVQMSREMFKKGK